MLLLLCCNQTFQAVHVYVNVLGPQVSFEEKRLGQAATLLFSARLMTPYSIYSTAPAPPTFLKSTRNECVPYVFLYVTQFLELILAFVLHVNRFK